MPDIPVQEKKEPKRNVEVETLARDSVVSEKDMQAIQEKVSAVMEKYQPEIEKAVRGSESGEYRRDRFCGNGETPG